MLWSMKKYGMISAFQEYKTGWERQDKTPLKNPTNKFSERFDPPSIVTLNRG